jgi:lipoprotein NlpD
VEKGDTLYSIAWRYDLTVNILAEINGLREPYTITKGQILNLDPQITPAPESSKPTSKITDTVAKAATKVVSAIKKPQKSPALAKPLTTAAASARDLRWQSPVQGNVIEDYNPKELRNGLVFKTDSGSSVRPVANGVVVYAGDGLRDYGKLVIIKHTDDLLSAYGHNQQIVVSEGQMVNNRQVIAKLGSSGRLYFEIRKDGNPVNPNSYIN